MTSSLRRRLPPHIVFDGGDGAGQTTQARLLLERLRANGFRTTSTTNPSAGPVGKMLRSMLLQRVPALPPSALQRLFVTDHLEIR